MEQGHDAITQYSISDILECYSGKGNKVLKAKIESELGDYDNCVKEGRQFLSELHNSDKSSLEIYLKSAQDNIMNRIEGKIPSVVSENKTSINSSILSLYLIIKSIRNKFFLIDIIPKISLASICLISIICFFAIPRVASDLSKRDMKVTKEDQTKEERSELATLGIEVEGDMLLDQNKIGYNGDEINPKYNLYSSIYNLLSTNISSSYDNQEIEPLDSDNFNIKSNNELVLNCIEEDIHLIKISNGMEDIGDLLDIVNIPFSENEGRKLDPKLEKKYWRNKKNNEIKLIRAGKTFYLKHFKVNTKYRYSSCNDPREKVQLKKEIKEEKKEIILSYNDSIRGVRLKYKSLIQNIDLPSKLNMNDKIQLQR